MMDLSGASALVTGGASGLGEATAEALAARGARVAVFDLNGDAARAVAARVGGVAAEGDVADGATLSAAFDALGTDRPLRVAVACAGIAPAARVVGRNGPHDLALFERVLRVNLLGTFNLLRLAAARMAASDPIPGDGDGQRGVVVMTSSIAGEEGQVGQCAYAASKGGVMGLTLPAARDLARNGVRVVTVAPGMMETPILATLPPEAVEGLRRLPIFPAGRLGRPEEFARMVLAAVDNPLLNGAVLRLDAALRLPP